MEKNDERTKRRRNDIALQEIGEGRKVIILITERKVKLIEQSLQDTKRFNTEHLKKENYGKTAERKAIFFFIKHSMGFTV